MSYTSRRAGRPPLPDHLRKKNLTLTLPPRQIDDLEALARRRYTSISQIMVEMIDSWMQLEAAQ